MSGPGLILIALIIATAVTIFYMVKAKHEETMAMIEHGFMEEENKPKSKTMLNLGIFFMMIGIGFIIGYWTSINTNISDNVAFPSAIFFTGGLGLVVSYFINKGSE